jgi:hypothetical protein
MRGVFAVAWCLLFGACATVGGGESQIYGIYDVISIDGATLPYGDYLEAWVELGPNGNSMFTMILVDGPGPMEFPGTYSLEEYRDGCFPFLFVDNEHPSERMSGAICGEVMNAHNGRSPMVLHKRR